MDPGAFRVAAMQASDEKIARLLRRINEALDADSGDAEYDALLAVCDFFDIRRDTANTGRHSEK